MLALHSSISKSKHGQPRDEELQIVLQDYYVAKSNLLPRN